MREVTPSYFDHVGIRFLKTVEKTNKSTMPRRSGPTAIHAGFALVRITASAIIPLSPLIIMRWSRERGVYLRFNLFWVVCDATYSLYHINLSSFAILDV